MVTQKFDGYRVLRARSCVINKTYFTVWFKRGDDCEIEQMDNVSMHDLAVIDEDLYLPNSIIKDRADYLKRNEILDKLCTKEA